MNEFEYLAVFVSIIFGISVTHILSGAIRSIYRGQINETHYVLTAFFFFILILNWWTGFAWRNQDAWSFDLFLVIVIWAVSHYLAAITLYPPQSTGTEQPFEYRRTWFLWAFVGVILTDILATATLGNLLAPWFYLPFVLHYGVVALLAIVVNKPALHRWTSWYFLVSIMSWSFIVRRFLD
jgi:hypothetical protein